MEKIDEIESRISKLKKLKEIKTQAKNKLDRIQKALRDCAIQYYIVLDTKEGLKASPPHGGQDKFHRCRAPIRVVEGGNRSGKSACGINEDVAHALGYRPWLEKDDVSYNIDIKIPNKGLIIAETFGEQVQKVIVPKLLGESGLGAPGAIPVGKVKGSPKKNASGIINCIQLTNGSVIYLQSYDQDPAAFESSDHDWIHYDEPPPESIWAATQRGLIDREGKSWITMTPLKDPWVFDKVLSRPDNEVGRFRFDIQDNVGFGLTQEGVNAFANSLDEEDKAARLHGYSQHLQGLVYKSYNHRNSMHRIKRRPIAPDWNIWMHIDTHPRTPHHALWAAVLPDNKYYIIGELKNSDAENSVPPFCEAIKMYESRILQLDGGQRRGISRLIEPGADTHNPLGETIKSVFAKNGIHTKAGSKDRDAGIVKLKSLLKFDVEKGVYPLIYFYTDLIGLHNEMRKYVWDDFRGKTAQGKSKKQVPKDKDDHFIEGLHRIILARSTYRRPVNKTVNRRKPLRANTGW